MSNIIKYKMNLEVLTPLHIGGAEYKSNITKKEYLFEEGNEGKKILRIVDAQKFIDYLVKNNLFDKYISLINKNVNESVDEHKRNLSLEKILEELRISIDDLKNNFQKKFYIINDKKFQIKNDIKLMIRDILGKPYIPGSSIKGALVNFLLVDYIIKHRNEFEKEKKLILDQAKKVSNKNQANSFRNNIMENIVNIIEDYILYSKNKEYSVKKRMNYKINKEEEYIFYEGNSGKKLGISISDSYSYTDTKTNFYQDYDEKIRKKLQSDAMPLNREYIMENSKFNFDIILDMDLLKKSQLKVKDINDLIKAIENATTYLIDYVLEDRTSSKTENLILGANTGFHQKTIIFALFEDKEDLTEVVKKILHKSDGISNKEKVNNHLKDKFSPRVLNRIKINGKNKLAGLVKISKVEEKNVGTN
jgi:CRISPR-associated RAMP protein, csm5 family